MEPRMLELLDLVVREGARTDDGVRLPPERDLAEMSGLSRSQVREMLSGLQMLGLLQKTQGSGNVLCAPTHPGAGNVFELMLRAGLVTAGQIAQAREMLEVAIAPRIVDHVSEAQIAALEEHVYRMVDASAAKDFVGGLEADHAFHIGLFEILDNPIMSYVVNGMNRALHSLLLERRRLVISQEIRANGGQVPPLFRSDDVHFEIIRALRTRKREAVTAAMTEHFDRWRRIVSTAPSEDSSPMTTPHESRGKHDR